MGVTAVQRHPQDVVLTRNLLPNMFRNAVGLFTSR